MKQNLEEAKEKMTPGLKEIITDDNSIKNVSDEQTLENEDIKSETTEAKILKEASLEAIVKNDYQEKTIVEMEIPNLKTIGIASDHRGYKLKQKLTKYLEKKGYTVMDYGSDSAHSSDYPEFGFKLAKAVKNSEVLKGIAICGSGIGISIACNKVSGIRAAKVNNVKEVKYGRKDNDANIIALNGKMPLFRAKDIVDVFLKTPFSNQERHQRRIKMLNDYKE